MSYKELGYNNLLEKEKLPLDDTITNVNADELIADGAIPASGTSGVATEEDLQDTVDGLGDLAVLDQVDTAQIVANAVDTTQLALLAVTDAVLASNAVIASKITTGAVTSTKINVGTLSAISANVGTLTSGAINGLTITGGIIQTSASANTGVKISTTGIPGIKVYDQGLVFYDDAGTQMGIMGVAGAGGDDLHIEGSNNTNIVLEPGTAFIYAHNDLIPFHSSIDLGVSGVPWDNVYGVQYYFNGGTYYLYRSGSIIYSNTSFAANGGSLHTTGNLYTGGINGTTGSVNCALVHLEHSSTDPSVHGEIRNYASGATDQFRGIPGDGTWLGSFDMTAA